MPDEIDEPILDLGLEPDPKDKGDTGKPALSPNALIDLLSSGGSPQSLLSALSGQLGGGPGVDMLIKLMGDNQASKEAMRDEIRAELQAQHADIVEELGGLAERLLEENRLHQERLERLASALGACPLCFGEDLLCEQCDGRGRPGSELPDTDEFNQFVSPALDRVKAEFLRPSRSRPGLRTPSAGIAETLRSTIAGVRP
jgi:hypothetical protein